MNELNHNRPNREWLLKMADLEDSTRSIAVGGMASDLGLVSRIDFQPPRVFGRLIEFARRSHNLTIERLAESADVELAEIVAIERDKEARPTPRTVFQLARVLKLPAEMLTEVAGLTEPRTEVSVAALRFAASSEPNAQLTDAERDAFEEFVKVLVATSAKG